ncbi:MAG: HD domain-containing protein [Desulfobulbaceae bacterium]|nr:HD domain-containing protein [Desulfobulbaceae bacterium]
MDTVALEHRERFLSETNELFHRRVAATLWIGIVLVPLFSVLDFFVVRHYFTVFLGYRLVCSFLFFGLLFFLYRDFGRRHPFSIALIAYVLAGATISLMVVRMGGYDSFYYVGILLVLVTCSAILPLDIKQAGFAGLLLYFIYALPIFFFSEITTVNLRLFFNNSFFFAAFIAISVVQCFEENRARIRVFNLRMKVDSHAERLEYYAKHLEDEVEKRARALEDSELRYRVLYENIIDIVLLIDESGLIMVANPLFYKSLAISNDIEQMIYFEDLVHPEDLDSVELKLYRKLKNGEIVVNFCFRIITFDNRILDADCNAKGLQMNNGLIGYQMVIRDVSEKKRLEKELFDSLRDAQNARVGTILGLAKLAEYRDKDTGGHLERIREYCRLVAEELAGKPDYNGYITQKYIDDIYLSSILHDIGKVGVPDAILLKPGKLTESEFEIIKKHTLYGGNALATIEAETKGQSFLALGKTIAYHHHEKWDGSGYPAGLSGTDIPLSTRIVALVDVYDAITSKRCYKDAFSHEKAMDIIYEAKGKHFAPDVVDAFFNIEEKIVIIRDELQNQLSPGENSAGLKKAGDPGK